MTEFRFPPLTLPEPTGVDPVLERAPARASCCGNCDQGLPCASKGGGGSGGHSAHDGRDPSCAKPCRGEDHARPPQSSPCRPSPQTDDTYVRPPSMPSIPAPLSAAPARGEIAKKPFWKPLDLEVKLKPILGCNPNPPSHPADNPDPDDWAKGTACADHGDEDHGGDEDNARPQEYCGPAPGVDNSGQQGHCGPAPKFPKSLAPQVIRCALTACNAENATCFPISFAQYSAKSRTQALFSYSNWDNGLLQSLGQYPSHGLADCSLIRAIARQIDATQSGDEVLIAISAWYEEAWPIVNAVKYAKSRGVIIRIISGANRKDNDGCGKCWWRTTEWVQNQLLQSLGASNIKFWWPGHSKSIPNISHNKFVLIHRKSLEQYLVLVSGANWAFFDIARHCDLLTICSKEVWWQYRNYWNALWFTTADNTVKYNWIVHDDPIGVTAHFWPVLTPWGIPNPDGYLDNNNPFYQFINNYERGPATKIRVIQAHWEDKGPGARILKLLIDHHNAGSDVRVVGNHHLDTVGNPHLDWGCHTVPGCQLQPAEGSMIGACETKDDVWEKLDGAGIPWAKCAPHAKVLLISGVRRDDNRWHQSVYTGSMNFSYQSDMADTIVGVHDDGLLFAQYEEWWRWLCKNTAMNHGGLAPVCGNWQPPSPLKPLKAPPKPTHG